MRSLAILTFTLAPLVAFGQITPPEDFKSLVGIFTGLIDLLIVLIFAITILVLIWAIVNTWIFNAGNEEEVKKGKKIVTIGIIVLVIMSGIWGILALLRSSIFGI